MNLQACISKSAVCLLKFADVNADANTLQRVYLNKSVQARLHMLNFVVM